MKRGKSRRSYSERLLAAALGMMLVAVCMLALGLAGGTRTALADTTPGETTTGETAPGETTTGETTTGETTTGETTTGGTTPGETTTGETTTGEITTGETTTGETAPGETTTAVTTITTPMAPVPLNQPDVIDSYAPQDARNLATGAVKVEASSSYEMVAEGWSKDFIKDGKLGYEGCALDYPKGWSTDPYEQESSATAPAWIRLTLDDTYEISRIVLFPRSDGDYGTCFPMAYTVRVSTDGVSYTDVKSGQETGLPSAPVTLDLDKPVKARYVELYISQRYDEDTIGGGTGNDGKLVQMSEMAVFGKNLPEVFDPDDIDSYAPKGTTNLALTATASASSTYEPTDVPEWSIRFLNNGVLGADGWSTDPYVVEGETVPAWAQLDLGANFALNRVVLFPKGSFPVDYTLQVSLDGKQYTDVHQVTGQTPPDDPVVINLPEGTEGRYLRLYVTKRGGTADPQGGMLVQLSEMAVFGKVGSVSVGLNKPALLLTPGMEETLKAEIVKNESDQLNLQWTSDRTDVATVDENGLVKAVAAGTAHITLTDTIRNLSASCTVYVENSIDWASDQFMISVFWPPTKDYVTDEHYKAMADAGIDYVNNVTGNDLNDKETNLKMAELAYKYGMQVSVADSRFGGNLTGMTNEQIQALVQEYTNVPGVGGFYILDEPWNPNPYARIFNAMKSVAPKYYAHLNFLPNIYGSEEAYERQMNDWVSLTGGQDYLMFDRYPYSWAAGTLDYAGMLSNMKSVWKVGLANDVKTGMYLQSIGVVGNFRRTNPAEIRYEANMAMAYGFKQLSYFTWWTPTNRSENFTDGIITADGQKTDLYEPVKQLNSEIHALGRTLINLDAKEIYFNGETWGQEAVPAEFFVQALSDDNLTFSYMRHKTNGRNYLFVVNNSFTEDKDVTLAFDGAITSLEEVDRRSGSLKPVTLSQGKLSLHLPKGEGYLFALPKDYDYEKADSTPTPVNENLALGKTASAPSSLGENGWFISNVTDGKRFTENGVNGWSTESASDSFAVTLKVDLGRVETINRVDLYPAGTSLEYGMTFPREFTLDVSEDGKQWTTVKTVQAMDPPSLAQCYSFESTKARYVRVSITQMNGYNGKFSAALGEIEVYNDDGNTPAPSAPPSETLDPYVDGENIAKGKTVIVSSSTPDASYEQWGWASKFLVDEDLTKGWTSNIKIHDQEAAEEWAAVSLGAPFYVEQIELYPTGTFAVDYQVQVSMDGKKWTTVADVTDDDGNDDAPRVYNLITPVKAAYIRMISSKLRESGVDGYLMQVAEIKAYGDPATDKTALDEALDAASKLDEQAYTPTSWAALMKAVQAGKDVQAAPYAYQYEADQAAGEVNRLMQALTKRAEFGVLEVAIAQAEAIKDTSRFTPKSLQVFQDALSAARAVMQNLDATQDEVDAAWEALNTAMTGLGLKAQKANLQERIAEAKAVQRADYTKESLAVLDEALAQAEAVGLDENAEQQAVDAANEKLQKALKALVLRPAQTQALADAVAAAGALTESNYTAESWASLQGALIAARDLLSRENLTIRDQDTVDAALEALVTAQKALEPAKKPTSTTANAASVSTGDTAATGLLMVLAAASATLLVVLWVARRKGSKV